MLRRGSYRYDRHIHRGPPAKWFGGVAVGEGMHMTTPSNARAMIANPRSLAAWGLVGYAGLHLFFAFFDWVLPGNGTLSARSAGASFDTLVEMAMPVVAVLLATQVQPMLSAAKTIATIALVEYAVIVVLGLLTLLIGVGAVADARVSSANQSFDVLAYFVLGLGRLVLAAVAGLVSYQAFTRLGGTISMPGSRSTTTPPAA